MVWIAVNRLAKQVKCTRVCVGFQRKYKAQRSQSQVVGCQVPVGLSSRSVDLCRAQTRFDGSSHRYRCNILEREQFFARSNVTVSPEMTTRGYVY